MPAAPLRRPLLALVLVAAALGLGCRSASAPHQSAASLATAPGAEKLQALLWIQTAEECRRLQSATFLAARRALEAALADPAWSALGQGAEAAALPPAVITDVDETLLDNSAFEAWLLGRGRSFNDADWRTWVEAEAATAVPGAVEFVRFAAERGVQIFYVTNRAAWAEAATRANLARAGFPLAAEPDVVLLEGERPEWTADKESRRRWVAARYRVLLLVGDDLNDFMSGVRDASVARRAELAERHAGEFGNRWFVLPNPLYGSWERALAAGLPKPASAAQVRARRLAHLRSFQ